MHDNNTTNATKSQQIGLIYRSDITQLQSATKSEILVWLVYSFHCNGKNNLCFPSVRKTMNMTGLSRPSVLRGIKGLKEKGILSVRGKTTTGVVKYILTRIISDTSPVSQEIPPSITEDTSPVSHEIPSGITEDTSPVSQKIPITTKHNNKLNIAIASSNDEKLFILLWNKWYDTKLCDWHAINPLNEYRAMRDKVIVIWEKNRYAKSLEYELQMIDIYLMQSKVSICGNREYVGQPRLWPRLKWITGIQKWLASSTPSKLTSARQKYIQYCIQIPTTVTETEPVEPGANEHKEGTDTYYVDDLLSLYELLYDCEDMNSEEGYRAMYKLFIAHYEKTPFPDRLRSDTRFYEYFNTIDRFVHNRDGNE